MKYQKDDSSKNFSPHIFQKTCKDYKKKHAIHNKPGKTMIKKLKHAQKGSAFGATLGLLVYLNVAVLGLSRLTAHSLVLRPGLEDLA